MQYNEKMLKHFYKPHNQGSIKNADAVGQAGNPICGDIMKIYLKIDKNIIKKIKFETMGCAAAIAASSVLTDLAKGKTIQKAARITKNDIIKEFGAVPKVKVHCSLLATEALKEAIDNYQKK
ncbi:iron-sulfur cluster assembly scaffold protein [Candidatus Parcubacteria bacterium]|nr:iron-sulfur cluster assembly scaffold protein [Candidatus Parcubacteria bacterium]